MPIKDLQQTWREIGRIRIGQRADAGHPEKLLTFRLTSSSEHAVRAAAGEYGHVSAPQPWRAPAGEQWEVTLDTAELDVVIPPGDVFSQWWERWTAAGCDRRCDGETEMNRGAPCVCPADLGERAAEAKEGRACRPITRLAVILPSLPDLGIWRLETHSLIAARELGATMAAVQVATAKGAFVPGRLRLDQRRSRRPGERPHDYGIPVLELPELRASRLLAGDAVAAPLALEATPPEPEPDELSPVDVVERPIEPSSPAARDTFIEEHGFPPEDIDPDSDTFLGPEPDWLPARNEPAVRGHSPARTPAAEEHQDSEGIPTAGATSPAAGPAPAPPPAYLEEPPTADERARMLEELHAMAIEHHREPDEAELFLADEAGLMADPQALEHASRRAWRRTINKLRAGDYDPTPLERANRMAARQLERAAARDPRTHQGQPDPREPGETYTLDEAVPAGTDTGA